MTISKWSIIIVLFALTLVIGYSNMFATATGQSTISGSLQGGYRVVELPEGETEIKFTVFRGDYIKFDFDGRSGESMLAIPSLQIRKALPADLAKAPYFKMKHLGSYPFSLGSAKGLINVVEYDGPRYQKLTAGEAADLIKNISPVVLDVRTPREYSTGHLENSILIPIQTLQQRYSELLKYRDADLLIYCATGNRSTVASKILIDNGFTRIYNMQTGIYDWAKNGHPVVR